MKECVVVARLHREKMRWVLDRVVSGEFAAGQMLPREVDLADSLAVSRGVAREVIRALEERGVVSVKHGRGATVLAADRWDVLDPEVLAAVLAGPGSRDLVCELVECRLALEPELARLAASRVTDETLTELTTALQSVAATPPTAARDRGLAEIAFHRLLVRLAANRPAANLIGPVLDAMESLAATLGRRRQSVGEHERILAAMRARDADLAAAAVREHLQRLADHLRNTRKRATSD